MHVLANIKLCQCCELLTCFNRSFMLVLGSLLMLGVWCARHCNSWVVKLDIIYVQFSCFVGSIAI
jgi:hypothetical protein